LADGCPAVATLNSSSASSKYFLMKPRSTVFFKELIALVAFAPYYRVNDQRMVRALDQYFADAVAAYADVSYTVFHKKLARKVKTWYELFLAVQPKPRPTMKDSP
jgi:hypothetical protein